MGLVKVVKSGAHVTHRILRKVSIVYKVGSDKLGKSKKNRDQRKMKKRVRRDYRGRHQERHQ